MTLEQLQAMSDDELNELAAVKVMGWSKEDSKSFDRSRYVANDGSYIGFHAWNPTNDMNAAMEIIESMRRNGILLNLYPWADYFMVSSPTNAIGNIQDEKPGRAITIAAILAKESE